MVDMKLVDAQTQWSSRCEESLNWLNNIIKTLECICIVFECVFEFSCSDWM